MLHLPSALTRPLTAALAVMALAAPAIAAEPPRPAMVVNAVTPDADQKLKKGEPVVLVTSAHPIYHLDVYGHVDGSPDEVWAAITSYTRYNEFLPLVTESSVRKRVGNTVHQFVRMSPPWPFHEQRFVNACTEDKRAYRLTFELTEGNVKMERGFWQLTPMADGQTRLHYHLTVDPWMDIMPAWVVEMATKSVMPDIVKGIRRRVQLDRRAGR